MAKDECVFDLFFPGDYREIIGTNIPYRDLGHTTLEEFLDHAQDTCRVTNTSQGYVLHGVATLETAHIAALVAKQAPKKRKNKPIMMPGRRPQSRGMWHPTPFVARGGGVRGGRGGFRGVGGYHTPQRLSTLPQNQVNFYGGRNQPMTSQYRGGGRQRGGGIVGGSLRPVNQFNHDRLSHAFNQSPPNMNHNNSGNTSNNMNHVNNNFNRNGGRGGGSGSNRSSTKSNMNGGGSPTAVSTPPPSKFRPLLEQLAGPLEFKTSPIGKRHISTVLIKGGRRFQTYPHEYATPEMAEDAACEAALKALNLSPPGSTRDNGNLPLETLSSGHLPSVVGVVQSGSSSDWDNFSITDGLNQQILGLLDGRTNGVWSTQIDVMYEEKFKKKLPPDWPQLLEKYIENHSECPLRVDSPISDR